MQFPRRSGVILHPTSLPGRFSIGDLGDAAFRFVDFLARARQTYWQVLPLGPTGYGDSPYQSPATFAGNPLLISPEKLAEVGHLSRDDLQTVPDFPIDRVDFGRVIPYKNDLLNRAFENFRVRAPRAQRESFERFCRDQAAWLDDVALFMALKEKYDGRAWHDWESDLVARKPAALKRARTALADKIANQKYRQWQFFEQWLAVKRYANERGIRIIGDAPIYVALDSADVWANPEQFLLDKHLQPLAVAGVPPDYFSATGQLWGNPLYRWEQMARDDYTWWLARFRMAFTQADVVRIDHFRGFYNYWQVPFGEATAVKGRWVKGPGKNLFRAVTRALGEVAIIAEDLGEFDAKSRAGVDALCAEFGYPGMKVLQFAFGGDASNPFLPHNYERDFVVYTGTHDNDTTVGWYQVTSNEAERNFARKYLRCDGSDIAWDFIRAAWSSVAHTAIVPAQDLLGLGHNARLNNPSTFGAPNWCWRMLPGALNDAMAARLLDLTTMYRRAASK
jgi:4-alpha-glucanotransferase